MFPALAPFLSHHVWGPFRLLGAYTVLIAVGTTTAALTTWFLLPRLWHALPCDRRRAHAAQADAAKGKPTGGGYLVVLLLLPWLFLVLPWHPVLVSVSLCLILCMLTGYWDDRSPTPWSEWRKGAMDLGVAALTSLMLCQGTETPMWFPFVKGVVSVPAWLFVLIGTAVLWFSINATNCTDGVDGLAGSLTLLSLFYLGGFLYVVVGNREVARYLLVPHNVRGAAWSILAFTSAGAFAGYLWHNAEPSALLMGDAGSRFLGLLIGVAVLVSGNPFLILAVAPVILVNGGTGLLKLILLRGLRRLGFDITPPARVTPAEGAVPLAAPRHVIVRMLHAVRFPLHDHCRAKLHWTNPQVLIRFVLVQAFLTPFLFVILVKLR